MLERELQDAVAQVARILGYRVCHFGIGFSKKGYRTPARYDGAGFCDLTIVGNGRVLFRELKAGRNVLSPEQAEWIRALEQAGADVGVWTDADWRSGLIEAELRRGTKHEREAA